MSVLAEAIQKKLVVHQGLNIASEYKKRTENYRRTLDDCTQRRQLFLYLFRRSLPCSLDQPLVIFWSDRYPSSRIGCTFSDCETLGIIGSLLISALLVGLAIACQQKSVPGLLSSLSSASPLPGLGLNFWRRRNVAAKKSAGDNFNLGLNLATLPTTRISSPLLL